MNQRKASPVDGIFSKNPCPPPMEIVINFCIYWNLSPPHPPGISNSFCVGGGGGGGEGSGMEIL